MKNHCAPKSHICFSTGELAMLHTIEKHAGAWLKHYVFPKVSKGWYVQAFSSIAYLLVAYNFSLRYPVTLYITLGVVCNALDDVKQISIFLATQTLF